MSPATNALLMSWPVSSHSCGNGQPELPSQSLSVTGLWCVWEDETHDDAFGDGGASRSDCIAQGGHWDQYNTITGINQQNGIVTQINTIFDNNSDNPYKGPGTIANGGAGMTLDQFDQTLQTYSQGAVLLPDVPLVGLGQAIQLVGIMTAGVTKHINCVAAGAYPLLASMTVTPEDVEDAMGVGEQAADQGIDSAVDALEGKADKLRAWHKASAPTANKAKALKGAGAVLKLLGAAKAGIEGGNNFANCEKHQ